MQLSLFHTKTGLISYIVQGSTLTIARLPGTSKICFGQVKKIKSYHHLLYTHLPDFCTWASSPQSKDRTLLSPSQLRSDSCRLMRQSEHIRHSESADLRDADKIQYPSIQNPNNMSPYCHQNRITSSN